MGFKGWGGGGSLDQLFARNVDEAKNGPALCKPSCCACNVQSVAEPASSGPFHPPTMKGLQRAG